MTRDEWLARDAAADDADRRMVLCPACRAGDHNGCENLYGSGADAESAADSYCGCECDCMEDDEGGDA